MAPDDRRWDTVFRHSSDAAFALANARLGEAVTHYRDAGVVLHRMIRRAIATPLSHRSPLGAEYVDTARMCRKAYNAAGEALRRLAAAARGDEAPDTSEFDAATARVGRCSVRVDGLQADIGAAR